MSWSEIVFPPVRDANCLENMTWIFDVYQCVLHFGSSETHTSRSLGSLGRERRRSGRRHASGAPSRVVDRRPCPA